MNIDEIKNHHYNCCFCKREYTGYGNNPYPVSLDSADICCDDCNKSIVIPARINQLLNKKNYRR